MENEDKKDEILKSNKITNFLIIGEWITIVGLFVATFSFTQGQIQNQSQRSDELYKEFIALLKEVKCERKG